MANARLEARIVRLEKLALAMLNLIKELWGGDGCWQSCWDEPSRIKAQIEKDHEREGS